MCLQEIPGLGLHRMGPALGYVLKQKAASHPKVSGLVGLGRGPRTGLSNLFPGAATLQSGTSLWKASSEGQWGGGAGGKEA